MKKTVKKLVLAKETVRNFADRELITAQGGSGISWQDSQKWCLNHPSGWTDSAC
jgi:hypothetical protein